MKKSHLLTLTMKQKDLNNLILDAPKLTIVKKGVFYNWLKQKK